MLPPGSTLGILGSGQLGRMLALAAAQLGYRVLVYSPDRGAPASQVVTLSIQAEWTDEDALNDFATQVHAVTYEFENIPLATVQRLEALGCEIHPSSAVLAICQHRIREKSALHDWGIPTAQFMAIQNADDLAQAAKSFTFPAVLKTAESGYDGKGQATIRQPEALQAAWEVLGQVPCILESFVAFSMEISVLIARDVQGNTACFDAVQNIHKHHILDETHAPAPIAHALRAEAKKLAETIAGNLNIQGLLAVEMFVTPQGLLVNELAPRPHNSGHWTMEACMHNQFDQCARAVLGLPLGNTERHSDARMKNLIGPDAEGWASYLADSTANLHLYGKTEIRPGRKMGHVTWLLPKSV